MAGQRDLLAVSVLLAILIPSIVFLGFPTSLINRVLLDEKPHRLRPMSFEGHQLWTLDIQDKSRAEKLWEISEELLLDVWTPLRPGSVDIRVSPEQSVALSDELAILDIPYSITHKDLQLLIDSDEGTASSGQHVIGVETVNFFENYHTLDEIQTYLDMLVKEYPDLVSHIKLDGKSYEKRDITGIKISLKSGDDAKDKDKPAFVFHGGIHAREWISPATVLYMATQLITQSAKDKSVKSVLEKLEFHIFPVLNVDGFVYTHTSNRMWRKNRQPNPGSMCPGTDPNRNWAFEWGTGGSSKNPCSEAYMGPSAFSAPEPLAMADYVKDRSPNVIGYIDFHAFSQLFMYPYGSDCDATPKDKKKLQAGGDAAAKAIKATHGTSYAVGSICNIIYQASGSSTDYMYAMGNVTYSYAVELRDTGRYGFLLPKTQIIPSGEETFAGLLSLTEYLIKAEDL
ncbi:hypothetical protein SmJEL517_g03601 [Synchytrium microbalum]|uniref:Carboxypeptidase M14A n=1 Tax=Synchytrium microbalum TaxID=1806994 RepID=A0A507C229_9FUNG|nr:uncharacterized protein SmJEL517_g03601 [Synchytrium microbalum]TPX33481.1 hypothetical protein SmJEL517_g03601 [Synchytrium microbalum]